jgi:excisionase family DNA binding protein
MSDQLLSIEQVAQRTGLSRSTLLQMRGRGEGPPSFRIGNRVRIKESALNEWLAKAESEEQARLSRLAPIAG